MVPSLSISKPDASIKEEPKKKKGSDEKKKIELFKEVTREKFLGIVDAIARLAIDKHVNETQYAKLLEGAINGILTSLDPHSAYFNPEDFKALIEHSEGWFGGLGLEVTTDSGSIKVISPIDGTPAKEAGIKSGDIIIAVDDTPTHGMSLVEAVKKMRGMPGTNVSLSVKRDGVKAPLVFKLTRAKIEIKSVKWEIDGDVGYIRISTFDENTTRLLHVAIKGIQKKLSDKLRGYVIDIRDNPGGRLDQVISAANFFIDSGIIVCTKGRNGADKNEFSAAKEKAIETDLPIVVIVNGGSASASEILAGALQDNKRAIIVGEKTFGKGSVQTLIPLGSGKEGGEGGIKLTIALFYTPNGNMIQTNGIIPDIIIEPIEVQKMESFPVDIKEKNLLGAIIPDAKKPDKCEKKPDSSCEKDSCQKEKDERKISDYQRTRAIELVRGLHIYTHKNKPTK